MDPLKVVFMGSPAFALPALDALAERHRVVAVYSQPPRPSGRGRRIEPPAVEARARALGLEVRSPRSLRPAAEAAAFAALGADAAIVVAYGLLLPPPFLEAPRLGCLNAHASLLPRWRGAAPIERAIMAGDAETGVTIMRMAEGLDTGPMLLAARVPIGPAETGGSLRAMLSALSATLLLEALDKLAAGALVATAQDERLACHAAKLTPADEQLDWCLRADALERRVRALHPAPGAFLERRGERIKVFAAEVLGGARAGTLPGCVVDSRFAIACGEGTALRPLVLQRPGRKALGLDEFLRGYGVPDGEVLP
jgi:methionyl-tRNA formyltransferase